MNVVTILEEPRDRKHTWTPAEGPELQGFLGSVALPSTDARHRVRDAALAVLCRCIPPGSQPDHETGLVVGYIQSGKTMSITAVTAAARDNGYALVVVITGTSVPLFEQSERRLLRDLRLDERSDRKWKAYSNPGVNDASSVDAVLADWSDRDLPDQQRRTVLLTVMKNHIHLANLQALLAKLEHKGITSLIIDDEADQASLNTRPKAPQPSTTYDQLMALRRELARHTFLQYTATPQAPLLISIIDTLSPSFAEVLAPGDGYTGGQAFFASESPLVRDIPPEQLPAPNNDLEGPPETLHRAMQIFYLGVADGYRRAYPERPAGNRSMLVHPSRHKAGHILYLQWVQAAQHAWALTLDHGSAADREDLLAGFRKAYEDLKKTVDDLAPLEHLIGLMPRVWRETVITLMDTALTVHTPQVNWRDDYCHIVVGGQALDRGYTVEGLTVTYLARPVGVGNADTIQQRARFFGYKEQYLGYCRVFLASDVADLYRAYVRHEEDIRNQLAEFRGRPLSDWKRAFFLSSRLQPTRKNVLTDPLFRYFVQKEWFTPDAPFTDPDAIAENRSTVTSFINAKQWDEEEFGRSPINHHLRLEMPLEDVLESLLTRLRFADTADSAAYTGLLLQLKSHIDAGDAAARAAIFVMSKGVTRERGVVSPHNSDRLRINNLFQGRDSGTGYPGDRAVHDEPIVTIQLHHLDLHDDKTKRPVASDIWSLAVWIPQGIGDSWVVQKRQ